MQKLNIKMENDKSKLKKKKHLPQRTQSNNCVTKEKNTENTEEEKREWPRMNTETHGLKKLFCCLNKKSIWEGKGISVHQCKSVANSGVLGWVLKTQKGNSVLSVVKKNTGLREVGSVCFYSFRQRSRK